MIIPTQKRHGLILAISAASGTGKTRVAKKICQTVPNVVFSVSLNTRPPRTEEVEGLDYFFVSEEVFDQNLQNGNLLEFVMIYEYRRGTPKNVLVNNLQKGVTTICVIEWNGVRQLKKCLGQNVVSIFLFPPSLESLHHRLTLRAQDSPEEIEKRFVLAKEEMENAKDYDYGIVNDNLEDCAQEIIGIIKAERQKMFRILS
jgi:guanylate kinase